MLKKILIMRFIETRTTEYDDGRRKNRLATAKNWKYFNLVIAAH